MKPTGDQVCRSNNDYQQPKHEAGPVIRKTQEHLYSFCLHCGMTVKSVYGSGVEPQLTYWESLFIVREWP